MDIEQRRRQFTLNHFMGWAAAMLALEQQRIDATPYPYIDMEDERRKRHESRVRAYSRIADGDNTDVDVHDEGTIPVALYGLWVKWYGRFGLED